MDSIRFKYMMAMMMSVMMMSAPMSVVAADNMENPEEQSSLAFEQDWANYNDTDESVAMSEAANTPSDEVLYVEVDILPDDTNNSFKDGPDAIVVAALMGSTDFDVNTIDTDSLMLGEAAPNGTFEVEDINADGFNDLIVTFAWKDTQLGAGEHAVTLKGNTKTGQAFQGSDMAKAM